MDRSGVNTFFKDIFKDRSSLLLLFIALILILLPILILRSPKKVTDTIREDQIKIQKGDRTLIVSEDGSVEYITPDGVYYETWDSERVSNFFKEIRALAKSNLNKPPPKEGAQGYWITLYIDGELVKIFVEGTNEYIEEILQELEELATGEEEPTLEDVFSGNTPTPTPQAIPTYTFFPSPTPTPGYFVGGGSVEEDCRLWLEQGLGSTVISNTVCILSSSPTPTP
ncbi:hypothetical protein A2V56_04385 [Candidatus Woesebacteria bacterium RBG_19FT_COMBO_42_9]|uniref:Uncharacterized protein n=1 Tax=Candidatus Woesebacteria bacterium RBG_16_42_24 TaxID=1802485 RepID=A0A1F7XLV2_9BACT|nr:MAG: hypothetical protein A2V97_04375 [Candidatus Woesebacteria bacterium RBG_16_42_24]OGM16206.1 MAG: hypothetical protein A2V56_04385 [Candidatus Woesebacteria bacterium RBG_19FT_COMBO_42_9]OGM66868.1 MAG: hypothetical protein A2985_01825 [Candidatus Woesebacteria bacterium RIFCSPLOWO2_01_FULL_43_11]